MSTPQTIVFCWFDFPDREEENQTPSQRYQSLVQWALRARGQNPLAFDTLTEWLLDDDAWSEDRLPENQRFLMEDVLSRLRAQNSRLRSYLKNLEPSGVVNPAVWSAIDRLDDELFGHPHDANLSDAVFQMFSNFPSMREHALRKQIAGDRTGPTGTDSVDFFGYVNCLKDCDAAVQWALFMPEVVQQQQQGFRVEQFEYKKLPPLRFIGFEGEEYADIQKRAEKMRAIAVLTEYRSELDFDVLFMHHYGLGVDVGPWHGVWGRFLKADAPVPEGYLHFDFLSHRLSDCFEPGPPYLSQFAYAEFSGDPAAIHRREGYDGDAMYDVTRNIMLGQGVNIPYPDKYWTAEVFPDGCDRDSSAYMFSAEF